MGPRAKLRRPAGRWLNSRFGRRVAMIVIWAAVVELLVFGITSNDYSQTTHATPSGPFVRASGRGLQVDGKPYTFIGVNRYDLLTVPTPYRGCGYAWKDAEINQLFAELKAIGVNAVRMSAFRLFTSNGNDFSRLDYLLRVARTNDIRVIPVLENQWKHCTLDGEKSSAWYRDGYQHGSDGYSVSYKDYVGKIVRRYKNDPTVLMWQLIGEAESKDESGRSDQDALYTFARDMSAYVKALDSNHLVSLGTIGGGQPGTAGLSYRRLHALWSVDVLEFHDYEYLRTTPRNLLDRMNDALALNKPLFVGEAGIKTHCAEGDCIPKEKRAEILEQKITSFLPSGVGYLLWSYRDGAEARQPYDFDKADPLAAVLSRVSQELRSERIISASMRP